MHVFCDESGGADPANCIFLVAAVGLSGADATRLLKSFRKATDWAEVEIKGHVLNAGQRHVFFDLLTRETNVRSIVVSCRRREALGGWAMSTLSEMDLYRHLLCEACEETARSSVEPLTITADGGRYKRADLRKVERDVMHEADGWGAGRRRTTMGFRDSTLVPGLQIADVIANTAFQSLRGGPAAAYAEALLIPLKRSGRLILRSVALAGYRPSWAFAEQSTEAAPRAASEKTSALRRGSYPSD